MLNFQTSCAKEILNFESFFQRRKIFFVCIHSWFSRSIFSVCQGEQWVLTLWEKIGCTKLQNSQCWNTWHLEKRHHQFWTTTAPLCLLFQLPINLRIHHSSPSPPLVRNFPHFLHGLTGFCFSLIICYCARRTSFLMRWAFFLNRLKLMNPPKYTYNIVHFHNVPQITHETLHKMV